jgi:hypothetical protein
MHFLKTLWICFFISSSISFYSQCLVPVNMIKQKDLPMPFPTIQMNLTAHRDTFPSKPYLYISAKGSGLIIYNISSISNPTQVAIVSISQLGNLHVMSSTQSGNYLYLALGDHFNASSQKSGMAIVNITNPASPTVTSVYQYSLNSGAGHVCVEGNYAYLSAMQNGIIVLDVTNKSSVVQMSVFKPSLNFPKPSPNSSEIAKINVRQVVAKNNVLYVSYDAGGVRIVNATNKSNLLETGQYSNPVMLTRPRAYNNLVLDDSLVYVACDYAGMEVLNVKDTSNITQVSWWNPWKADMAAVNQWTNSPGHTNEIEYDPLCKMLFMTAGRSDVMAVSVANPLMPDSCARFGSATDSLGTWGLGRYNNQLYVSYLFTGFPFYANWGGTKILTYNNACFTGITEYKKDTGPVFPNPASGELFFNSEYENGFIEIYDLPGQKVFSETISYGGNKMNVIGLSNGSYFYKISAKGKIIRTGKLIIAND